MTTVLHIDQDASDEELQMAQQWMKDKDHVYVLVYLDGCGPCNQVRPEWQKLPDIVEPPPSKHIGIMDINQAIVHRIPQIPTPLAFPTIQHFTHQGNTVHSFDDSLDRSASTLAKWIQTHSLVPSTKSKAKFKAKSKNRRSAKKRPSAVRRLSSTRKRVGRGRK